MCFRRGWPHHFSSFCRGSRQCGAWRKVQTRERAHARRGLLDPCRRFNRHVDDTISVYWRLDKYPTRAAAEPAKGRRGTVVESLGKVWLLSIEDQKARDSKKRVAEIGPLVVSPGQGYSVQYMEAIFTPGMTAPEHTHSGPEAWYTMTGETCLESPDGRIQVGRAGGPPVIVPAGLAMHLTATGRDKRRALVLILHPSSQLSTALVHNWVSKGLCKDVRRVP